MLDRRPGDGEAVVGGGAAPDFVEDHQRPLAGLIEDGGGLHHLHHEGGAPAREVVRRADAGEEPVDRADAGGGSGDERAHLGQHRDQRILAQEGALACHVGAGDEPDAGRRAEVAIVGHEGRVAAGAHRLHHRMAPAFDLEGRGLVDDGPRVAPPDREVREPLGHVERGQRPCRARDVVGPAQDVGAEVVEVLLFEGERPLGRAVDPAPRARPAPPWCSAWRWPWSAGE